MLRAVEASKTRPVSNSLNPLEQPRGGKVFRRSLGWFIPLGMIHLDTHPDRVLSAAYDVIEGWLPCPDGITPTATLSGEPVALYQATRPDLGENVFGFRAFIDWRHVSAMKDGSTRLAITIEGQDC